MSNFLSMEEIVDAVEGTQEERVNEAVKETKPSFIIQKEPDRQAAAYRYYLVERILREWHGELNDESCNTREMPNLLIKLYDKAVDTLLEIRNYERELML